MHLYFFDSRRLRDKEIHASPREALGRQPPLCDHQGPSALYGITAPALYYTQYPVPKHAQGSEAITVRSSSVLAKRCTTLTSEATAARSSSARSWSLR